MDLTNACHTLGAVLEFHGHVGLKLFRAGDLRVFCHEIYPRCRIQLNQGSSVSLPPPLSLSLSLSVAALQPP